LSILDRLFAGEIVKDFGALVESPGLLSSSSRHVFLSRRRRALHLVIKSYARLLVMASITYRTLRLESACKLRDHINECERIAASTPLIEIESKKGIFGRILRDFGCIEREDRLNGGIAKSARWVESKGDLYLILEFYGWSWARAPRRYYEIFDWEDTLKLREFIYESESISHEMLPLG